MIRLRLKDLRPQLAEINARIAPMGWIIQVAVEPDASMESQIDDDEREVLGIQLSRTRVPILMER